MNYVLGGGITGLIVSHCLQMRNDHPIVITDSIGDISKQPVGPRLLYETEATKQFLKTLSIDDSPKEFEVGFCESKIPFDIDFVLIDNVTNKQRLDYYNKTRHNKSFVNANVVNDSMSFSQTKFIGWDVNEIKLFDRLLLNANVILSSVTKQMVERLFENKRTRKVVSTIPFDVMMKLFYDADVECFETEYCYHVEDLYRRKIDFKNYNYIYNVSKHSPIKRYCKTDTGFTIESTEKLSMLMQSKFLRCNRIVKNNMNVQFIHGVETCGRFAEVNHSVTMDKVIERFYNG